MPIDTSDTLPSGDGEIDDRLRELEEAREELAVANEELSVQQEELLAQQDELLAQQDQLRRQNLALEAERQRYRELFELAPDGYLVTDRHGTIREANQAACALLGAPAWSVIDRPLSLYLPQGEHSVLWAHLRELRQGRVTRVHNWQTTLAPREGPLVDVLISIAPAAAPEGEVTGLRWLLRDITQRVQWEREREHLLAEQVRAEQALRANMEKYKVLFESFPLGITVTDEQGQIVEANLESERLLGVSQQAHREREVDGAEWEIVRLDGSPMPTQEYASVRALREKRLIEDVEMGIVRRDGDTTWISVTAAPVPVQGYGVAVAYGDISARVRAERALAESEARFRAAVANSSLVLSQTDRQLRYRWVANPHPDFDPAAVVGKRDDELEDSAGTRRLVALKQQVLDSGTGMREEVRFDRSDGIHVYDMTIEPLRDPAGQIVGVTTASVDITQRVRAEQRLQQYAERLRLQHQVDRAILSARSADEMVEAVLRQLPRLLPCLRAGVNLLDPEAGEVWLLATYSAEETSLDKGWHAPVAESLGEAMAQLARGERFLVDDMQARPPWSPLAAQLQAEGVRAEILQPLIVQGELIGAFGIGMTVPGPLPEEQLEAVGELADALAVGIQQMRLYDQVRRYATELEERVRTRTAQLATSEARFRAVYEQAAIGIALLDGQGRLLSTNPALQRMLGYQAHELQGLPLSALADAPHPASPEAGAERDAPLQRPDPSSPPLGVIPEAPPAPGQRDARPGRTEGTASEQPLERRAPARHGGTEETASEQPLERRAPARHGRTEGQPPYRQAEYRYRRQDGGTIHANVTTSPIHLEGEPTRLSVALIEDVTERRQAQEALRRSERLALTGRLAASVAHEIGNPLQAVIGCLSLAQEVQAEGEDTTRYMQLAMEELDRAARLVARMRDLNRPSEGQRKPVAVNDLLERVLLLSRKQCQNHRVQVKWEAGRDLPPVPLVADRVQQVFLNLVLNAVDAMPEGGELAVRTAHTPDPAGVTATFADTGTGIPEEQLERLFEPFASTKTEGLGLGLYVSRNIIHEHGGHIHVDSTPGRGTTFTVWLPADA